MKTGIFLNSTQILCPFLALELEDWRVSSSEKSGDQSELSHPSITTGQTTGLSISNEANNDYGPCSGREFLLKSQYKVLLENKGVEWELKMWMAVE